MKNNLIRVFINEKSIIEISPFASVYSLKYEIQQKYYKKLQLDNLNLYFNSKPLDNKKTLFHYKITNDATIDVHTTIKGGKTDPLLFFKIIYMISIPIFILFLWSGLPPIVGNLMACAFDSTLVSIFKIFYKEHPHTLQMSDVKKGKINLLAIIVKYAIKTFVWVITKLSTVMFVWVISAYMVFPYYYLLRGREYCDAGEAAKKVGKLTTIWYMLIYVLYNFVDFILSIGQLIFEEIPLEVVSGAGGTFIQTTKEAWDITKFGPLYAIPIFGQILLLVHEVIEEVIALLYEGLDEVAQVNCDQPDMATTLCKYLTEFNFALKSVKYEIEKKTEELDLGNQGSQYKLDSQHEYGVQKIDNDRIYIKRKDETKMSNKISRRINKMAQEGAQKASFRTKMKVGALYEPIKNYKLGWLLDSLQQGFCDRSFKENVQQKRKNRGQEPLTDEQLEKILPPMKGTKYDTTTFWGGINRWGTSFIISAFCQTVEALNDLTSTLWCVGTENQFVNMIKTGQIAGIVGSIAFLISVFLN